MKKIAFFLFTFFSLCAVASAQTPAVTPSPVSQTAETKTKPKRGPVFRANKEQVTQAQKMLKVTETGKLSKEDRAALKTWQTANGLKSTGTLNRVTLEKMNVALTDKQKEMPVAPNSMKDADSAKAPASMEPKKRGPVFRANKDQITEVQTKLKTGGMYVGETTGKLDDPTREAIKKWQTANGVKVTGTLNKETLEKMGIALTDKQKEM